LLETRLRPHPGREILSERLRVAANSFLHTAAIWARIERRRRVSDELFCANLVDMWLGALTAPVSEDSQDAR
jgi:hypothetical protein